MSSYQSTVTMDNGRPPIGVGFTAQSMSSQSFRQYLSMLGDSYELLESQYTRMRRDTPIRVMQSRTSGMQGIHSDVPVLSLQSSSPGQESMASFLPPNVHEASDMYYLSRPAAAFGVGADAAAPLPLLQPPQGSFIEVQAVPVVPHEAAPPRADEADIPMEPMAASIGLPSGGAVSAAVAEVELKFPGQASLAAAQQPGSMSSRSRANNLKGVVPLAQLAAHNLNLEDLHATQSSQDEAGGATAALEASGAVHNGRRYSIASYDSQGSKASQSSDSGVSFGSSDAVGLNQRHKQLRKELKKKSFLSEALSPAGSVRMLWDTVVLTVIIMDVWGKAFDWTFLGGADTNTVTLIVDVLSSCFFAVDIVLNFFTGFFQGKLIVQDVRRSRRRYLRTWFWLDVLAALPYGPLGFSELRAMSLLRVVKCVWHHRTSKHALRLHMACHSNRTWVAEVKKIILRVASSKFLHLMVAVALCAHFATCLVPLLPPQGHTRDLDEAVRWYWESFTAILDAILLGEGFEGCRGDCEDFPPWATVQPYSGSARAMRVILSLIRISFLTLMMMWTSLQAIQVHNHFGELRLVKHNLIRYLRRHNIRDKVIMNVVSCLNSTHKLSSCKRHFVDFSKQCLPENLHRSLASELWLKYLLTMGPILHSTYWNDAIGVEVAMRASEEIIPPKTTLIKRRQLCATAYHIITGSLNGASKHHKNLMPFIAGQWVGEQSLVNPRLREVMTIKSQTLCTLMAINGEDFAEVLQKMGLAGRYQEFCTRYLLHGLCGRCGTIGEHFTAACTAHVKKKKKAQKAPDLKKLSRSASGKIRWMASTIPGKPILSRLGSFIQDEADESTRKQVEEMQQMIQGSTSGGGEHLLFLSHYKKEAGTEAALIAEELEWVLPQDPRGLNQMFVNPIFLDSELLSDLAELQVHVRHSHNLAVLLTPGVLLRPWCLIEITVAVESGVHVIPVTLQKNSHGEAFRFPDEDFYMQLRTGSLFDRDALEIFSNSGISLERIELAVRSFQQNIAISYSPHRNKRIRAAEIAELMHSCKLRSEVMQGQKSEDSAATNSTNSLRRVIRNSQRERPEGSRESHAVSHDASTRIHESVQNTMADAIEEGRLGVQSTDDTKESNPVYGV